MLQTIWFLLWGLLWAIYFMLDGFDLGIGCLLPFVAKNESDKRTLYSAMGPYWDGNEVWLITAGGVTFAAFPNAYATMFTAFYSPLMLILFALIVRGVAMEFRSKLDSVRWKKLWDTCLFSGSFLPALLFGVAFANIFRGIPFDQDGLFRGNLLTLLNFYGLLGGLLFLLLFLVHGALWLAVKTQGNLHETVTKIIPKMWLALLVVTTVFLSRTWSVTELYKNYQTQPLLLIIPLSACLALLLIWIFIGRANWVWAWLSSAITIVSITLFGIVGLFPALLPSSTDPDFSVTIYNAASSELTLKIMLAVTVILVPVVIIYQFWAYHLFRGKVKEVDLHREESY